MEPCPRPERPTLRRAPRGIWPKTPELAEGLEAAPSSPALHFGQQSQALCLGSAMQLPITTPACRAFQDQTQYTNGALFPPGVTWFISFLLLLSHTDSLKQHTFILLIVLEARSPKSVFTEPKSKCRLGWASFGGCGGKPTS